ncbi:MAG: hypothetical protein Q9195_006345 [Heterodermia aff. obscurata]
MTRTKVVRDHSPNSDLQDATSDSTEQSEEHEGVSLLKRQLSQCLEGIGGNNKGDFAKAGTLSSAVNPGLSVRDLGTIGLPLSEREAVELGKACHQAPFGKGSETIVDTMVRNTWELNADQFELQNPTWQTTLDEALEQVAGALDVVGGRNNIRAELYKLLIYNKGAFFDSHTDTEKAPGMFGTLVIALPSKHTGGDVQAKFGGQSLTLATAGSSAFGYSYLAWYSDVEHTVLPVISGHRLVLTYNLIQAVGSPTRLASCPKDDQAKLGQILALWNHKSKCKSPDSPFFLSYMLHHKYTDANLRLDHLKGKDAYLARYLQTACLNQDFCYFLANIERTISGGCEDETYDPYDHYGGRRGYNWHDEDDEDDVSSSSNSDETGSSGTELDQYHELSDIYDTSLTLRTLYRASGQLLANKIPIEELDIVQDDVFDRNPDSEAYEGFTGNAGASATHTYRNSCIVIMPRQSQTPFLLGHAKRAETTDRWNHGDVEMEAWIAPQIEELSSGPAANKRRVELAQTCELIVAECNALQQKPGSTALYRTGSPSLSNTAPGLVARAALQLKQPLLFKSSVMVAKESLPIEVYRPFGEMLGQVSIVEWRECLELALSRILCVQKRWMAVTALLQGRTAVQSGLSPVSSDYEDLANLLQKFVADLLLMEVKLSKEDAQALVEMIRTYGQSFLFSSILPFVKKHASDTTFSIAFLVLLFEAERDGATNDGVARNIFRDVLADLIPTFKMDIDAHSPKKARHHYSMEGDTESTQSRASSIDANDIASLLDYCRTMQLTDEKFAIMDQLLELSKTIDPSGFSDVFIPLLARLVKLSQVNDIDLNEIISKACFQNVLTVYVQRYIGLESAQPRDWAQSCAKCSCEDCQRLSQFMMNPSEKVGKFAMAERRRRHLEYKLHDTGCTLDTVRQGSPHTLVVTKTLKKWHEFLKGWKSRCKLASESFRIIGTKAIEEIFGEHYEEFVSFKAVKLVPAAPVSAEPQSSTSKRPRPPTTASVARPAPTPSFRAPHTAIPKQDIQRKPMSMLSQSISRTANAHDIARIKSKLKAKEASSNSEGGPKTPHLGLPLKQGPSTSATEYIDLT